jgi:hypothetical protein
MSAAERADFLNNPCALTFPCAGSIRYVLWGPLERTLAPDDSPQGAKPRWTAGLTEVYNANGYTIYENP